MRVNVKNMQRVPHVHRFTLNIRINGRDRCDTCPYRDPRPFRRSIGGIRPMYDFEKERLLIALLPKKTNDELKAMILKRDKDAKISKMKKSELVSTLTQIVKNDTNFDPTLLVGTSK